MKNIHTSPKGKFVGFLKVLIMGLVLVGCGVKGWGQVTISSQDFETTPATPTLTFTNTNGGNSSGTNGAGLPANANLFVSGARGWEATNTTSTLIFANQSLAGYTNCFVDFRIAGMSINGTNGIDAADIATLSISVDGGFSYSSELTIAGSAANQRWDFTSNGTTSLTYDGNNTPTAITSSTGAGGISTGTINIPNVNTQVRVRITLLNNDANERWVIDDLRIRGTVANAAPTASSVSIAGTTTVGQTLTGSYTYADTESDPQGTSTFKWYRADDAAGTNEVAIGGATATTYTLVAADLNKFIRFSVIPIATSGTLSGVETFSARVGLVCITPTLSSASQASTVICGSGTAVINMGGLVANSLGNRIDYSINGVPQTQITGVNADASGNASFTTASLTTANNGQTLQITGISHGACNITFTQNVTLAVATIPTAPVAPTVTGTNPSCGATSLNIIVPAGGETYYWQGTTALGTSTASPTSFTYPVSVTGTYYVRSQNNTSLCWSTANSLLVTINTQPATPPTPASVSIGAGNNTSFTATTPNAASYSWEVNPGSGYVTISNGGIYSNATTATLNLTNVPLANNGYLYRATAVGSSPCVNSAASLPATLTVTPTSSATDYFMSNVTSGNWATAASWLSSPTGGAPWITATLAPTNAASGIIIQSGHTITVASSATGALISVNSGSTLILNSSLSISNKTGTDLILDGTLTRNLGGTLTNAGTAIVSATGIYNNYSASGNNIMIATWNSASNCNMFGFTGTSNSGDATWAQTFGNMTWDGSTQSANGFINVENSSFAVAGTLTINSSLAYFSLGNSGLTYSNTINNLVINGGIFNVIGSAGTENLTITNDVTVTGGTMVIEYGSSGTANLTVSRDFIVNGSGLVVGVGYSSACTNSPTINISRDLVLSGASQINLENTSSTASCVFTVARDFTSSSTIVAVDFGTGSVTGNAIQVGRNFSKSGTGTFQTTSSTLATGFVFTGGTLVSPSTLSYSGANSNYTSYVVGNNAVVQLLTDLTLGSLSGPASYFTVNATGTLDFVAKSIVGAATNPRFITSSGSTLITSNANGFGGTTATGSLISFTTTSASSSGGNAQFAAGLNYVFNGNTTSPFPLGTIGNPGSLTFNALVTSNRTSTMTVSGAVNINATAGYTLNATTNSLALGGAMTIASTGFFDNGGQNQITGSGSIVVSGIFKTQHTAGLYGTGTTVPGITITFNTGSTLEYSGANQAFQNFGVVQVPAFPTNIIFSGSGTKTGGSINSSTITNPVLITIKNAVIVDATAGASFGGTGTSLTMEANSKLNIAGSGTQPNMDGTYTLDPTSTIEFAGTSASVVRLAPTYALMIISGTNVANSSTLTGIKFQTGGTFTVKNGATFKLSNTAGFSNTVGSVATAISNVAPSNPTITLELNSTTEYSGAAQTITTATIASPTTANYYNLAFSGSGAKTAPASDITILGNLSASGSPTFNAATNSNRVVFASTGSQTFTSTAFTDFEFYNVSKTSTGTLIVNSKFGVLNELNLVNTAFLFLNTGDIVMRSTPTRTAYITNLGVTTASANITYNTGRFSIERYLRAFKSWRLLATPIIGGTGTATINESWREAGTALTANGYGTRITGPGTIAFPGGVDEYSLRGSMKSYSMALNNYVEVTSADLAANKTIANNEGYYVFVRGDRGVDVNGAAGTTNLRMRGQIRTGNQTFSVNAGAFQSVGNPFASQIDFRNVSNASIAEAFTIWNPSSAGSYNVGAYETYVKDLNPPNDFKLNGTGAVLNTIESGQAFFIQSISAGSITIKEADKTTGSSLVSRENEQGRPGVTIPTLEINLHTNDINGVDYIADAAIINFNNSYSSDLDNLDVKKITNAVDNLVIKYGTINLVAERRPNLVITDSIRLGLTNTRIAPYRFEIDPSVLGNLQLAAFLKDKFLQTETPVSLTAVTNYNFNITADAGSRVADRFMIVFREPSGGPLPVRFMDIAATKNADKTNTVKWTVANEISMQQYQIERSDKGTNFVSIGSVSPLNNMGGNYTYNFVDAAPLAQDNYYRIKAISVNGQIQYSAIVKILADVKEPFIAVSPNPVENKTMQLQMGNQAKGLYSVQLINSAGQIVYRGSVTVNNYMQTNSIELDKNTATGNYQLLIVSANGYKTVKQIMVQ